ncbi:hypothetical protein O181_039665 [Austropuccinia psidii MF-1]|uniref:Uncharacterized protein n=1 Tax=Austropuccinia psidii MF-1 TaxID=1389203 RepID=A0A9Q3DBX4_9BASI|nr:hypothetical protein [Austropuccinia psidii MF-1]
MCGFPFYPARFHSCSIALVLRLRFLIFCFTIKEGKMKMEDLSHSGIRNCNKISVRLSTINLIHSCVLLFHRCATISLALNENVWHSTKASNGRRFVIYGVMAVIIVSTNIVVAVGPANVTSHEEPQLELYQSTALE